MTFIGAFEEKMDELYSKIKEKDLLIEKQAQALVVAKDHLRIVAIVMRSHPSGLDESCNKIIDEINECLK